MKKPVYTIEVLNVFFLYSVGEDFIGIATRKNKQFSPLPDYVHVDFSMNAPTGIFIPIGETSTAELDTIVGRAIRAKIAEQKKTGVNAKPKGEQKKTGVKQESLFDDVKQ